MPVDLVRFGFTPTESLAYSELVSRGPTTAYELSKVLGVARANTYQALNGLVSKGAAVLVSRDPQLFKPVTPAALLALISSRMASDIDWLDEQIRSLDRSGTPTTVEFEGLRALSELVLRTAVRASTVTFVAPAESLRSLTPIWRKREVDGAQTDLWVVRGQEWDEEALPFLVAGQVEEGRVVSLFGSSAVVAVTPDAAILGRFSDPDHLQGYWSCDPLWLGSARGAIFALTS